MFYLITLIVGATLMCLPRPRPGEPERPKPYMSKQGTWWHASTWDPVEKEWIWEAHTELYHYYCAHSTHNLGNTAWFTYSEDRSYTNGPIWGTCYNAMDSNRE